MLLEKGIMISAMGLVTVDFKIAGLKVGTAGCLIMLSLLAKLASNLAHYWSLESLKFDPADATEEQTLAISSTLIYYKEELKKLLSDNFEGSSVEIQQEL